MKPAAFTAFDSREIPGGRLYAVHAHTRCIAYGIADAETLHRLGAVDGLVVFAFVELDARGRPRRIGTWRAAYHQDDLLEALETARAGLDPSAPRPLHRSLQQLIEERLQPREEMRLDFDVDIDG